MSLSLEHTMNDSVSFGFGQDVRDLPFKAIGYHL